MRRFIIVLLIAALALVPSASAMDCPAPGPQFGDHVSSMAPDCAKMHGNMFGKIVSSMATGEPCPCPMHSV